MKNLHRILCFVMMLALMMSLGLSAFANNNNDIGDIVFEDYAATYINGNGERIAASDGTYATETGATITINNALLTDVTIVKTWEDDNDHDGVRPAEGITLALVDDVGNDYGTYQLTADDADEFDAGVWTHTFTDLVAYNTNGNRINYAIREVSVDGYESDFEKLTDDTILLTNHHENATVEVSYEMVWDDDNDREGLRSGYTVAVFAVTDEGEVQAGNAYSVTDEKTLSETWVLDKYDAITHEPIQYIVKETEVPEGYEATVTEKSVASGEIGDDSFNFVITNKHEPKTVAISVTKNWDENKLDDNGVSLVRPDEITVYLYANYGNGNELINTMTLSGDSADETWYGTFETDRNGEVLYDYANGQQVIYTIDELAVPGYSKSINNDNARYYANATADYLIRESITNTYSVDSWTEFAVEKNWEGVDAAGMLMQPVTVTLYRSFGDIEHQAVRECELSAANGWSNIFDNLPETINGYEVEYTVAENEIADFVATYDYDEDGDAATITNAYNGELVSVSANNVWNDGDNQDGVRPESVEMTLSAYASGEMVWTDTETVSAVDDWSKSWTELAQKNALGQAIDYVLTVSEVEDYTSTMSELVFDEATASYTATATHAHTPETTTIIVNKTWVDSMPEDFTVNFALNANNVPVGLDESLTTLNTENDWTVVLADLPVYANGEMINYSVRELNCLDGYTATYSDSESASGEMMTITNTFTPGDRNLDVSVVWDDDDDFEGFRPDEVTIYLFADGESAGSVSLNSYSGWYYNFTGLPIYDENGNAIVYTVSESEVPEYTTAIAASKNEDVVTGYTVTNTHEYRLLTLNWTRIWDDDNNRDGLRDKGYISVTSSNSGAGTYFLADVNEGSFAGLREYCNGEKVSYTVMHMLYGEAAGNYEITIGEVVEDENGNLSVEIIDKHEPEMITFEGAKIWDDENNVANKRPESIEMSLMNGNEAVQTVSASGEMYGSLWNYEFEAVPVYANGEKIDYAVVEQPVANYNNEEATAAEMVDYFSSVTNTPDFPLTKSITVNYIWDDNDNADGIRPETVTLVLEWNKGGAWSSYTDDAEKVLSANESTATWDGLPIYDSDNPGTEIQYRVGEKSIDGYEISGYGTPDNDYTIVNIEASSSDEPSDEPTEPTDEPTEPTDEPTEPTDQPTDEPQETIQPVQPSDDDDDNDSSSEPSSNPTGNGGNGSGSSSSGSASGASSSKTGTSGAKTGDWANLPLMFSIAGLALIGLIVLFCTRKKREDKQ